MTTDPQGISSRTTGDFSIVRAAPQCWERLRAIRLAALAQAPEMFGSTLAREQEFDESQWRARARRPATFIAVREGVDVGLAGAYDFGGKWELTGMWVAPSARGTGVVEALVHECTQLARAGGAEILSLGVMEDNPRGLGAYRRLGFAPTGERVHVRDGRHELMMSTVLSR